MERRKSIRLLAGVLALGLAGGANACGEHLAAASAGSSATEGMTLGEVRKVEPEQGKVMIRHEPIAKLQMPAMTMVFRAQQPKVLRDLKPGDRVRFQAESSRGMLFVTRIEQAN
jgi:Cu(I)/Ag(I) efflux system protein CusF